MGSFIRPNAGCCATPLESRKGGHGSPFCGSHTSILIAFLGDLDRGTSVSGIAEAVQQAPTVFFATLSNRRQPRLAFTRPPHGH